MACKKISIELRLALIVNSASTQTLEVKTNNAGYNEFCLTVIYMDIQVKLFTRFKNSIYKYKLQKLETRQRYMI